MRLSLAPALFTSPFEPTSPACPACNELMIFKTRERWTMMYEHQLGQYAFECLECGYSLVRIVDEDQTVS